MAAECAQGMGWGGSGAPPRAGGEEPALGPHPAARTRVGGDAIASQAEKRLNCAHTASHGRSDGSRQRTRRRRGVLGDMRRQSAFTATARRYCVSQCSGRLRTGQLRGVGSDGIRRQVCRLPCGFVRSRILWTGAENYARPATQSS